MLKNDRTLIAGLLTPHFPTMEKASSQEWQDFLNGITGLEISDDIPNGEAFDKWRQALSEQQGLPVWNDTQAQKDMRAAKLADVLAAENKRRALESETLLQLRKEAPLVTVTETVKP